MAVLPLVVGSGLLLAVWSRVHSDQLELNTGLMGLAGIGLVTVWLLDRVSVLLGQSRQARLRLASVVVSVFVAAIAVELYLRFGLNKHSNYYEQNGSRVYRSNYQYTNPSWFHAYPQNSPVAWSVPEFSHQRSVNSLGLPDRDIGEDKDDDEHRVLALGDSFTEGIGASAESTWVRAAERVLARSAPTRKVVAINAGIAGSDVIFEYMLLKERLLALSPDVVIVAVNHSDVQDIIIRGGPERFREDGTTETRRKGPPWEWLYGISYIARHIMHDGFNYNFLLMRPAEMSKEEEWAVEEIKVALSRFSALGRQHGFNVLVAFHPEAHEVIYERYDPPAFQRMVDELQQSSAPPTVDLLRYYLDNKLITKENHTQYYWSTDWHHRDTGYKVMGEGIADAVLRNGLLTSSGRPRAVP